MQHCHGAPGIVNTMADFPGSAIDDLLAAAGETIWQVGPLKKVAASVTERLETALRFSNCSSAPEVRCGWIVLDSSRPTQ